MEKPILFSGPMVRAILEGRKTQTRRVLKPQPSKPFNAIFHYPGEGWFTGDGLDGERYERLRVAYAVGDLLWVREAWSHKGVGVWTVADARRAGPSGVFYRADDDKPGAHWFPSIHMPREFSRITLRVTAVKVERLQDISEDDAKAEGVEKPIMPHWAGQPYRSAFRGIWHDINGPGSWDANPWVAAYSFERVT